MCHELGRNRVIDRQSAYTEGVNLSFPDLHFDIVATASAKDSAHWLAPMPNIIPGIVETIPCHLSDPRNASPLILILWKKTAKYKIIIRVETTAISAAIRLPLFVATTLMAASIMTHLSHSNQSGASLREKSENRNCQISSGCFLEKSKSIQWSSNKRFRRDNSSGGAGSGVARLLTSHRIWTASLNILPSVTYEAPPVDYQVQ